MAFVSNDKIKVSLSVNATKTLLMLATQHIDLLTSDNMRLKHRVQELTDQCNEINNKLHEKDAEIANLRLMVPEVKPTEAYRIKVESPSAPTLEELEFCNVMNERDFDGLLRMFEAQQSLYAEDKQNLESARHHAQKAYEDALKEKKQMQARIDELESELAYMKHKYEPEKK